MGTEDGDAFNEGYCKKIYVLNIKLNVNWKIRMEPTEYDKKQDISS